MPHKARKRKKENLAQPEHDDKSGISYICRDVKHNSKVKLLLQHYTPMQEDEKHELI